MVDASHFAAAEFGIIIACCDQDLLFAKGCCASIRYFCGDIPICLIVDGNVSVDTLKKTYGITALYAKDIPDERLRNQSFGFGLTKMVALWHSPFKRFLFLDSDTVMWGNVPDAIGEFQDAVIDSHFGGHTDEDIDSFYFKIAPFEQAFPNIDWRKHKDEYFCSGVFAVRTGLLNIDEYLNWLKFMRQNPGLIKPGDQTLLNLMLFESADKGEIKLSKVDMQYVTHAVGEDRLKARFPFVGGVPKVDSDSVVIHWAGAKPISRNRAVYPAPMTFFRRKFVKDATGQTGPIASVRLFVEDVLHQVLVTKNRVKRLFGKIIRRGSSLRPE